VDGFPLIFTGPLPMSNILEHLLLIHQQVFFHNAPSMVLPSP